MAYKQKDDKNELRKELQVYLELVKEGTGAGLKKDVARVDETRS